MKRAYSILQSCCRRKGKLRKEKEMFASVRKERNGKGDGSSTTITPRALIHAQKLRCTLWTWGKKQIMGHKHIILYIYTYIFTSCNLLLPMIYIKSVFADQHLFFHSIRMHKFHFQSFLTCCSHIYMDLPVRQKLDLRQPTQEIQSFPL